MLELDVAEEVTWVNYEPEYKGNRDLPSHDRLIWPIRRPNSIERVTMEEWTRADLEKWRRKHMQRFIDEDENGKKILKWSLDKIRNFRIVAEHSGKVQGVTMRGVPVDDALTICVRQPVANLGEPSLMHEIHTQILHLAAMTEGEIKNFAASFSGSTAPTSNEAETETVSGAPVEGGD